MFADRRTHTIDDDDFFHDSTPCPENDFQYKYPPLGPQELNRQQSAETQRNGQYLNPPIVGLVRNSVRYAQFGHAHTLTLIHIRPYVDADFERVTNLWETCGLARPWNNPARDIALSQDTPSSELFVGLNRQRQELAGVVATVMTGNDGHRGWLYYLAVHPTLRRQGLARKMVHHAEVWLAGQGVRKVQLMIRDDNEAVRIFYERVGYAVEPRIIMSRWLKPDD